VERLQDEVAIEDDVIPSEVGGSHPGTPEQKEILRFAQDDSLSCLVAGT
jgi:hypothetical protein